MDGMNVLKRQTLFEKNVIGHEIKETALFQ